MPQYKDDVGNGYWADKPAHPDHKELGRGTAEKWDRISGEQPQEGIDKPTTGEESQPKPKVDRRKPKKEATEE